MAYWWVYTIKIGPDGKIGCLWDGLVAKGYMLIFYLDYGNNFSQITKIVYVGLFLTIYAIHHWPLHQKDIKNAFLHGELQEEVYTTQPSGFIVSGASHLVFRICLGGLA